MPRERPEVLSAIIADHQLDHALRANTDLRANLRATERALALALTDLHKSEATVRNQTLELTRAHRKITALETIIHSYGLQTP